MSSHIKHKLGDPEPAEKRTSRDSGAYTVLAVILFAIVFLQRFAIPVSTFQVEVPFIVAVAGLFWLYLRDLVEIDAARLLLLAGAYAILALTYLAGAGEGKPTSFGILLVIYALFVLRVSSKEFDYLRVLTFYQTLIAIIAVVGILQFFSQFFVSSTYLFAFDGLVPDALLLKGFNTVIPLQYGSTIFKSNGFFLLEPSIFSQYLALAIVIEVLYFRSRLRLSLYAAAILFSYSGTGLLLLAMVSPFLLKGQNKTVVLGALAVLGMVMLAAALGGLDLDVYTQRAEEFTNEKSSGFQRFVAPLYLIKEFILTDVGTFLFGKGPGTINNYTQIAGYISHDPTWAKLLFEYGLVGFVSFLAVFLMLLFRWTPVPVIAFALFAKYFVLGGYFLSQLETIMMVVLVTLHSRQVPGISSKSD